MALNDVYQLIDVSTMQGQEVLNVYFYKMTNSSALSASASELVDSFIALTLPLIRNFQVNSIVHTQIRCRNLFNPSDTHDRNISVAGLLASTEDNTFDAISFRMTGDNGAVRNGSKRYAGFPDTAQGNGTIVDAAIIVALNALALQLNDPLLSGVFAAFAPVIVKRVLDAGEYRLPDNQGESITSTILSAVFAPLVTSQTSRKIGVGE